AGDLTGPCDEFIGTTADITERVEAEAALRARQELLDLAQQSAHVVAFEWRFEGTAEQNRWSSELAAMFGLAPDDDHATFLTWHRRIHPDDWPTVRDTLTPASRSADIACEYRVIHPDESLHWLQARGRTLFDGDGHPARTVGFMLDV